MQNHLKAQTQPL